MIWTEMTKGAEYLMNTTHITNAAKLIEQLSRFTSFVHHMDGQSGFLSFRDTAGYLGQEEDYKSRINGKNLGLEQAKLRIAQKRH